MKWLIPVLLIGVLALRSAAEAPPGGFDPERIEAAKRRLEEKQRAALEARKQAAAQPATRPVAPATPATPTAAPATVGKTTPAAKPATAGSGAVRAALPAPAKGAASAKGAAPAAPVSTLLPPPSGRSDKEIGPELSAAGDQAYHRYPLDSIVNKLYIKQMTGEVGPPLERHYELLTELAASNPHYAADPGVRFGRCEDLAILSLLDHPTAAKTLNTAAHSAAPADALWGRMGLLMKGWWEDRSIASQQKAINQLREVAKANPSDDMVLHILLALADNGAASNDLATAARDVAEAELKGPAAVRYKSKPNKIGRPLTITGTTVQGRPFSSDAWKGKVVLVDFWATWCGPCRASLPELINLYQEHHARGLEVVGVSCDSRKPDLQGFLAENTDIAWPQLFGPSGPNGWHALAGKFGINSVPTMYLIDRNGVFRELDRSRITSKEIVQLLDEKPKPVPAKPLAKSSTPAPATRPATVIKPPAPAGLR